MPASIAAPVPLTYQAKSPFKLLMVRFSKEKIAVAGMAIILLFVIVALLAPVLAPYDPLAQNIPDSMSAPSPAHWLGADKLGQGWEWSRLPV